MFSTIMDGPQVIHIRFRDKWNLLSVQDCRITVWQHVDLHFLGGYNTIYILTVTRNGRTGCLPYVQVKGLKWLLPGCWFDAPRAPPTQKHLPPNRSQFGNNWVSDYRGKVLTINSYLRTRFNGYMPEVWTLLAITENSSPRYTLKWMCVSPYYLPVGQISSQQHQNQECCLFPQTLCLGHIATNKDIFGISETRIIAPHGYQYYTPGALTCPCSVLCCGWVAPKPIV